MAFRYEVWAFLDEGSTCRVVDAPAELGEAAVAELALDEAQVHQLKAGLPQIEVIYDRWSWLFSARRAGTEPTIKVVLCSQSHESQFGP